MDVIDGGDGNDSLVGWNGRDDITGGPGLDVLLGGRGVDALDGADESAGDVLDGGPRKDECTADVDDLSTACP
jgi:Ca2+-binding RTX toxin-like protein